MGNSLTTSQLTLNIGQYAYNSTAQQFQGSFPATLTSGNWNMVQAVVTSNVTNSLSFGRIFNFTLPNFQATATAAFRARDICVILDYSGSMRFASLLGTPYSGNRSCNNQDAVAPVFGHYSSASDGMVVSARTGNAGVSTGKANCAQAISNPRGAQTVLPPSIHPSGEQVRWEDQRSPLEIDATELHRLVALIAAATLLARAWPVEGARHEASVALAGGLLSPS